jgi:ATP-binding cassette subfamily B protein
MMPRHWGSSSPQPKVKDVRGILMRLWRELLTKHKAMIILVFVMTVISSILGLTGPFLIGLAINAFVEKRDAYVIVAILSGMLTVYSISALFSWLQSYIMAGISQKAVTEFRGKVFTKLQTLPVKFFDSKPHGELMSRLTNDMDNISNVLGGTILQVFSSAITVIGALGMMLWLNPLLTFAGLFFVPAGFIVTGKIATYTRKFFIASQKDLGALNANIEEIISAQKVVKVFAREQYYIQQFVGLNDTLKKSNVYAQIFAGVIPPIMNMLNNLSLVMIAATGGWMVISGTATLGTIGSFLNYSRQFSWPLNEIANQFNMVQSALAGAERVYEIMDQSPESIDESNAIILNDVSQGIRFDNVSFGYVDDLAVLQNIDLAVNAGETIALVGPTGAGKTTIANLLTRFYDVNEGSISIDDSDIKTINRKSLRSIMALVLQDTYLFSDTVRSNILYGRPDATDQELEQAARLANADNFIRMLPLGYDTVLSEGGENLSHGQRQLLAIARAILADPEVLILDEATSNVDTLTELHIREAMQKLMKGRTSFVIAHRLSTVQNADQIVVINGGKVLEKGNHEDLLKAKGFYYNLYNNQFKRLLKQRSVIA